MIGVEVAGATPARTASGGLDGASIYRSSIVNLSGLAGPPRARMTRHDGPGPPAAVATGLLGAIRRRLRNDPGRPGGRIVDR